MTIATMQAFIASGKSGHASTTKHDVTRTAANQPGPVVESLAIMAGQIFPSLFHLDKNDGLPDQIRKRDTLPIRLLDPLFQRRASLFQPGMPESLEEPVQEDLGLPLLVPLDVRPNPRDEIRKPPRSVSIFVPSPLLLKLRGDYNTEILTIQSVRPKSRAGGIKDARMQALR